MEKGKYINIKMMEIFVNFNIIVMKYYFFLV